MANEYEQTINDQIRQVATLNQQIAALKAQVEQCSKRRDELNVSLRSSSRLRRKYRVTIKDLKAQVEHALQVVNECDEFLEGVGVDKTVIIRLKCRAFINEAKAK